MLPHPGVENSDSFEDTEVEALEIFVPVKSEFFILRSFIKIVCPSKIRNSLLTDFRIFSVDMFPQKFS
jgi:hypothetical protein